MKHQSAIFIKERVASSNEAEGDQLMAHCAADIQIPAALRLLFRQPNIIVILPLGTEPGKAI